MPFRIAATGAVHLLLITSRSSGRWVIPKGNLMRGFADHVAAAREAYEEAGIRGYAYPHAIGTFDYLKHRRDGSKRAMTVAVYPLAVTRQLRTWPEQGQRRIGWFTPAGAAQAVDEPDLKRLIERFRAPAIDPANGETEIELGVDAPSLVDWLKRRLVS